MKFFLSLILIILSVVTAKAQQAPPEILNYQGVARNSVGNVLPNKTITLRITIHDLTPAGSSVYQETRTVTTNPFGLFNIQLGSPGFLSQTGTIGSIPWNSGAKFIQVEIDPDGGSSFINIGTAQLASVPYALYAANAIGGNGTLNFVTKWTPNGSTLGNSSIWDDGTFTGIGTTTPFARLTVVQNNSGVDIGGGTSTGSEIKFLNAGTAHMSIYNRGNNALTFAQTSALSQTDVLGSPLMTLTTGGNLGIGTTTPNAPLQFATNVANRKVVLYGTVNNDNQFYGFGVNSNTLRYQVDQTISDHVFFAASSASNSVELMRIKGNGNVGIGTSAPTAKLHVGGSVRIVDGTQGAGKILTSDASGNASWQALPAGITGSGTANFISKWTPNGTTLGNSQIFDNGTNVGINQGSPAAKLDVNGTFKLTDGTQGNGKILVSDAAGNASWQNNDFHVNGRGFTSNTSLPSGVPVTLNNWSVTDQATAANWNSVTGEYTVSSPGVYSIFLNVEYNNGGPVGTTPGAFTVAIIQRNGGEIGSAIQPVVSLQVIGTTTPRTEIRLNAGDIITFQVLQTSGQTLTLPSANRTQFGIHLVTR